MTMANVSTGSTGGLPPGLRTAQKAIDLPEVQEMLRRLSEFNLGVFMPHKHDEQTGDFQLLPDEVTQVESGLQVSFQRLGGAANEADRFLPVGWCWRAGAVTPVAVCEMVSGDGPGDTGCDKKHQMIGGNLRSTAMTEKRS